MIDVTIKITIDEAHEEEYENILEKIEAIEGIEEIEVDGGSYLEYNIDSTKFYEEEEG